MKTHNVIPSVNTNTQPKQNVAFKGNIIDKYLTLNRQGPMSRNLFVVNAFVFLLGSRILTSRDKDERREILIRDIPTIVIAVMGVPFFGKQVAKLVQKKSGFAIMQDTGEQPNKVVQGLRKIFKKSGQNKFDVISYSQTEDLYKFDKNLSSGFRGFSERLKNLGDNVNLKKIYSSVSAEVKEQLKNFSDNNTEFINQLAENKSLTETIVNELSKTVKEGNKVLKAAEFMKTIPTLGGFAVTLLTIGMFIPKLNIYITEKIHKNRKKQEDNLKNPEKAA